MITKCFGPRMFLSPDFQASGGGSAPLKGYKLKPEYTKPGRPEIIRKILVVDDEPLILNMVRRTFRGYNLEMVFVDPAKPIKEQVLDSVAKGDIDLIIMDGKMPGTSGPELTRILRENGFAGYIAANTNMPEIEIEMLDEGADFAINKLEISNLAPFIET